MATVVNKIAFPVYVCQIKYACIVYSLLYYIGICMQISEIFVK